MVKVEKERKKKINTFSIVQLWHLTLDYREKAIKSYKKIGYVEEGILRQGRLRMSILKSEFLNKECVI